MRLHDRSLSYFAGLTLTMWLGLVTTPASAQHYTQSNLVSSAAPSAGATAKTDTNLINGWGLSRSSSGPWWLSANGTGKSTLYDGTGAVQALVVNVPGTPTGTLFNSSQSFQIAAGKPALFLFVSEDGTISGWNSQVDGTNAKVMVTNSGAVYKGAALASVNGQPYLYAANFHAGTIDVYDGNFKAVSLGENGSAFSINRGREHGGSALRGLSPFNIQNLGGTLYVTYALPDSARHDEVDGPGLGLIAAFTPTGRLLQVFEQTVDLNAPWGLALAPGDFGVYSHQLLVGQFGTGQILAFNVATGAYSGKLLDATGKPIAIAGLWGLGFGNDKNAGPATTLYFAAGPNGEKDGLFGSLTPLATDAALGNSN